jgi:hypothetical protein
MSSAVCFPCEQLSLFDTASGAAAVNLFDGREYGVTEPTDLMKRLVPRAAYAVVVGDHPQALVPTRLKPSQIPEGHEFYHYMIAGNVYAGTFVGG